MSTKATLSAPSSPDSSPSDVTAPLLVAEDLHSISSSDEATSDWSSPSDASDVGAEDEEGDEGFDLLASQELRQLPSDSSASSDARRTHPSTRMTLSFPDPINSTSPATDSDGDAGGPTGSVDSAPPLSPAPSSGKVRADLDNSILVDGGSYSLLLDASPPNVPVPASDGPVRSPSLSPSVELEITSTPPPESTQVTSPRPDFLRSHPSKSSSTIIRVKRSSSVSTSAADNKVDKWRSTLVAATASLAATPTSPRSGSSLSSSRTSDGSMTAGHSTTDLSSVNSSQTVRASSPPSTPLARSLIAPNTSQSRPIDYTMDEKSGPSAGGTDQEKPGNAIGKSSIPSKLDRIIAQSCGQTRTATSRQASAVWWNRVMIGLTLTGVALAGIGVSLKRGFQLDRRLAGEAESTLRSAATTTMSVIPRLIDDAARRAASLSTGDLSRPSSSPSSRTVHHSLPTAQPPVSLLSAPFPVAVVEAPRPDERVSSEPKSQTALDVDAKDEVDFSRAVYTIDPPYPLAPVRVSDAATANNANLDEVTSSVDDDDGGDAGTVPARRVSSFGLRDRIVDHARTKRDETLRLLEHSVASEAYRRTARKVRRNLARHRHRGSPRKRRRSLARLARDVAWIYDVRGVDGFDQRGGGGEQIEFLQADGDARDVSQGRSDEQVGEERTFRAEAWRFIQRWEQKLEHEIKLVLAPADAPTHDNVKDADSGRDDMKGSLVRLARYPVVRDYYQSTKDLVKQRIPRRSEHYDRAREALGKVWRKRGLVTSVATGRAGEVAELTRRIVLDRFDRAKIGLLEVRGKKHWKDAVKVGEKHVKRAAKAVRKLEKRDAWQTMSEPISSVSPGDKYIGLALAISSSIAIGTSFIITKKGLISAADQSDGFSSDSYSYLKNGLWWAGMLTTYTFAPPVLVTPLGALSVLIGAVLAAFFLGERLGPIGISGCSLCLVGSLIIVLHAPEDKEIATVDEILDYALQPGFMFYCLVVLCYSLYAIYRIAPKHGTSNPLVYISICSLVGSVSVMAVKGFGVALKLTFAGNNQLWRAGTWIFAVTVVVCIAVQMNYFNKALDLFPTTVVNPSYFVGFSSCTLLASIILFHGLNTTGGANTLSLLCGLFVICLGVYLLNLSRSENESSTNHRRLSHSTLGGGGGRASHSYLEGGSSAMRNSLSNGGGRLSMQSDGGDEAGRRSQNLFRSGGLIGGGVPAEGPPLFDYHQGEDLHLQKFAVREDSDEDDYSADERRGLRTSR
ncbi:hypothetical protein JCM11491_005775 [Sporobolomyces phaffii]